jgi:hypothetical protein
MFGRPKKSIEVGKPLSAEESIAVKKALKRKYPDMVNKTGAWSRPRKKAQSMLGKVKESEAAKQNSLEGALSAEEIDRLMGKKKK